MLIKMIMFGIVLYNFKVLFIYSEVITLQSVLRILRFYMFIDGFSVGENFSVS